MSGSKSISVYPTPSDWWHSFAISRRVRGYSGVSHYAVFRRILETRKPQRLLIVGVYFGRDIRFFLDIARRRELSLSIVGVDKFSDDACEDWPQESKELNWREAGFGDAPSIEATSANVMGFGNARLVKEGDEKYLESCSEQFDCIYLDTSHDYETVARQIGQATRLLSPGGFLFGDDYSDEGTWGVKKAVSELLPHHVVFNSYIWFSEQRDVALIT